jgi:hypothetical protein
VICGFQRCSSLRRIEIPSSVEIIDESAFEDCHLLNEVVFASDSRLKEIRGFQTCVLLHQIEIPASVLAISSSAFRICRALRLVVFSPGSVTRAIDGFKGCTPFFICPELQLAHRRRLFHLRCSTKIFPSRGRILRFPIGFRSAG